MADTLFDKVLLQCSFNGENESTSFIDDSLFEHGVTAVSGAKLTTATKKYGTAAVLLGSSGRGATIASHDAFGIGAGDFTVEAWCYINGFGSSSYQTVFNLGNYGSGIMCRIRSAQLEIYILGAEYLRAATIPIGEFFHCAWCRSGGITRMFLNGVQQGDSIANAGSLPANALVIGYSAHSPGEYFDGIIDDLRITAAARYVENFTPPGEMDVPMLSGSVKNDAAAAAARSIRVYRRDTGAFVGATTSGSDGNWSLKAPSVECQVVCLDDGAGTTYNDLIHRATPV